MTNCSVIEGEVIRTLVYIFIGGGLGSVMRFLISDYTQKLWYYNTFPAGTFLVNVLGCFLIGIFSAYFLKVDSSIRYFLMAGFCGGFTTFSTFSSENFALWQSGHFSVLIVYVFLSITVGLLAVLLGFQVIKN